MDDAMLLRYSICDDVVGAVVCGQLVLTHTKSHFDQTPITSCVLSETGQFIWKRLEEQKTTEEIVSDTIANFEGEPDQIRESVRAFLISMERHGMIRIIRP